METCCCGRFYTFHSVPHLVSCLISTQLCMCELWRSTHSLLKVSPPEDEDLAHIINRLAAFIAEGGPELERKALEDYKDNPMFS